MHEKSDPFKLHPKIACIATVDMSIRFLLLQQLLYLKNAGYDVYAICANGIYVQEIESYGIKVLTVPMSRKVNIIDDLKSIWKLVIILRKHKFDLVHTHTPKAGVFGRVAGRLAGIPHVIHTDFGLYFEGMNRIARRLTIWLERFAGYFSELMLFEDDKAMEVGINEGLCKRNRARWIGGGINLDVFDRRKIEISKSNKKKLEFGFEPDTFVVGIVARLVKEKGLCEFLEAASKILHKRPDIRFLIVGPIDYDKTDAINPNWAKTHYGFGKQVVFAGVQLDMPLVYSIMNVFVLPTHRDSWPRSPMEAAALGVPVIVTDLPGVRTSVIEGKSGYVVPMRDSDEIAKYVLEIASDTKIEIAMGKKGRSLAEERFDEAKVFQRVDSIYREILFR